MVKQARVTLRDIASTVGVEPSTVSRILRNPGGRRTATRERVLAAVQEFGYRPNVLARSLTLSSAPIIPLLVPDVSNWFFADVARGAEEAASAAGYSLILCNTEHSPDRERSYLESLAALQVPAAIVAPHSEASLAAIRSFASLSPVVTIDRLLPGLDTPAATVDNYLGGRLATQHLVGLDHHQVVCVAGPSNASTAVERVRGYSDVLHENGLDPVVIQGGFTTKEGVRAARQFLRLQPRPTAVVCANDLCALSFVHELIAHDVQVPGDVSVVGYDDQAFSEYLRPALTSIHQPARRLGEVAVELALAPGTLPSPVRLRPRLVVRESTARRRRRSEQSLEPTA